MTLDEMVAFIRARPLAVVATSLGDRPEAALVGIAVTDDGELVFDTDRGSRKLSNLVRNHRVALVIGWEEERTLQAEGDARVPEGAERASLLETYFSAFPDGRERAESPDIVHVAIRPDWARLSDFSQGPRVEAVDLDRGRR